jgi:hypothetical protein
MLNEDTMRFKHALCLPFALALLSVPAMAQDFDVKAFFAKAADGGRAGMAQKTKIVDAKPAATGEVVVTIIRSEGVETKSKPAESGDMVVRNRCAETGNEQYLVKAASFAKRYGAPQSEADAAGWRAYRPSGVPMRYVILAASEGPFSFMAPWGEAMVAKPGDAIVQDPANPADTYRVAAAAFACTYDITEKPKAGS